MQHDDAGARQPNPLEVAQLAIDNADPAARSAVEATWDDLFARQATQDDALNTQDTLFWSLGLRHITVRYGSNKALKFWNRCAQNHGPTPLHAWELVHRHRYRGRAHISLDWLGDLRWEPLQAMIQQYPKHRADLLTYLAKHAPERHAALFVKHLGDTKSAVREVCAATLIKMEAPPLASICQSLHKAPKHHRLATAKLLRKLAAPQAVDALTNAIGKEKNAEVQAALQSALEACTPANAPAPTHRASAQSSPSTETTVIEALKAVPSGKKLPKFLQDTALPTVRTLEGQALGRAALLGFIALLRQEGPNEHLERTCDLTQRLMTHDVIELGEHIYKAWKAQGSMRKADLWGLYQLGHTAGPESMLYLWMLSQRPNKDVERWLTVLERRQTPIARTLLLLLEKHYKAMDTKRLSYADLLCASGLKKRLVEHREAWSGKEKLTALAASGRLRPGFGIGLLTLDRVGGDHLWGHWRHGSSWRWTQGPHTFVCSARHHGNGRPGSPQQALELFICQVSSKEGSKPDNDQVRKALATLKSRQQGVDDDAKRFHKELKRLGTKVCWTHTDWHQQMCVHPISRLLSRGMLFQQPDGPVFGVNPDFEPVDAQNTPVIIDKSRFILRATTKNLSKTARKDWTARLKAWETQWVKERSPEVTFELQEASTSDHLGELRGILYDAPSVGGWRRLTTFFDSLLETPQAMAAALDYALPLLKTSWEHIARAAPAHWLLPDHFAQRSGLPHGHDPRLALCNTIKVDSLHWLQLMRVYQGAPGLSRITTLVMGPKDLKKPHLEPLRHSDFLPALHTLHLIGRPPGNKATWRALCKSPLMKRIGALRLVPDHSGGCQIAHIEALAQAGVLTHLAHFDTNASAPEALLVILDAIDPSKLQRLDLGSVEQEAARMLSASDKLAQLQQLTLSSHAPASARQILQDAAHLRHCLRFAPD